MQVIWDKNQCCHAGLCVKSLPAVFKVDAGQFVIDPNNTSDEEIEKVINKCPSGALKRVD